MSIMEDARGVFGQLQSAMGTSVIVRHVTGSSYDSESDLSNTITSSTVDAVLEPISETNAEFGQSGIHIEGDFIAYISYSTTVDIGDSIVVNSMVYRVNGVKQGTVGGIVYQECIIKKTSDTS